MWMVAIQLIAVPSAAAKSVCELVEATFRELAHRPAPGWRPLPETLKVECATPELNEPFGEGTVDATVVYEVMDRSRMRRQCATEAPAPFRLRKNRNGPWTIIRSQVDHLAILRPIACGEPRPAPADDPHAKAEATTTVPRLACKAARVGHAATIRSTVLDGLRRANPQRWKLDEESLSIDCHSYQLDPTFDDAVVGSFVRFVAVGYDGTRVEFVGEGQHPVSVSPRGYSARQGSRDATYHRASACRLGRCPEALARAFELERPDAPVDLSSMCASMLAQHRTRLETEANDEGGEVWPLQSSCSAEGLSTTYDWLLVGVGEPSRRRSVVHHALDVQDGDLGLHPVPYEVTAARLDAEFRHDEVYAWAQTAAKRCRRFVGPEPRAVEMSWVVLRTVRVGSVAFEAAPPLEGGLRKCLERRIRPRRFPPQYREGPTSTWLVLRPDR